MESDAILFKYQRAYDNMKKEALFWMIQEEIEFSNMSGVENKVAKNWWNLMNKRANLVKLYGEDEKLTYWDELYIDGLTVLGQEHSRRNETWAVMLSVYFANVYGEIIKGRYDPEFHKKPLTHRVNFRRYGGRK